MIFIIYFLFSLLILFLLRKIAKKVGLTDKPNERKLHSGQIPLVGGLSIYIGIITGLYFQPYLITSSDIYILCASILVFIGVLDDKYDISFKIRLIVQMGIACLMILGAGSYLENLGNLVQIGNISLGPLGYLVTVFAVIGAINAFNMIDGIDGLLGCMGIVSFLIMAYLANYYNEKNMMDFCIMAIVVMIPYMLLNLGMPYGNKFKVFMGDAGSMFIGFTMIWALLQMTQTEETKVIFPVTALWVIALPLLDMGTVMIRRVLKGRSPFKADREHLHHLLLRSGLSSKQVLFLMVILALLLAVFGIFFEVVIKIESISFLVFCLVAVCYYYAISKLSHILMQGRGNIFNRLFRK